MISGSFSLDIRFIIRNSNEYFRSRSECRAECVSRKRCGERICGEEEGRKEERQRRKLVWDSSLFALKLNTLSLSPRLAPLRSLARSLPSCLLSWAESLESWRWINREVGRRGIHIRAWGWRRLWCPGHPLVLRTLTRPEKPGCMAGIAPSSMRCTFYPLTSLSPVPAYPHAVFPQSLHFSGCDRPQPFSCPYSTAWNTQDDLKRKSNIASNF